MSCLDSNVFDRIYLVFFLPSLVLRDCTHAVQVNCILLSKGQYVLVCLRTLIHKQFCLCSFETLIGLIICLRFRLTFPVLHSSVFLSYTGMFIIIYCKGVALHSCKHKYSCTVN
jgi:hypothetical protein